MTESNQPPVVIYRRRRAAAIAGAALALLLIIGIIVWIWPSSSESSNTSTADNQANNQGVIPNIAPSAASSSSNNAAPTSTNSDIPAGTPTCQDDYIAVTVSTDKPNYKLGEKPIFMALVTNTGKVTCKRNVGTGMEQLEVLDFNGNQIWTNLDCDTPPGMKETMLNPGQQIGFNLQWQAKTSVRGCPANSAKPVPAGQYQIIALLSRVSSKPETFNITA